MAVTCPVCGSDELDDASFHDEDETGAQLCPVCCETCRCGGEHE